MKKPTGITTLSAFILAGSLLAASDAQAGAALLSPGKTTGASITATIVIDVTQTGQDQISPTYVNDLDTGLTSIRVQKASTITAALFSSSYITSAQWTAACTKPNNPPLDAPTTAAIRFTGLIDTFVDNEDALKALFSPFGIPHRAAIVNQDYVTCTHVGPDGGGRNVLSFTAVIQFCVPSNIPGSFCP
jgi:hypothetical protein